MKKTRRYPLVLSAALLVGFVSGQRTGAAPPLPPPVYPAIPVPRSNAPVYVYNQTASRKPERSYLISPTQAESIINRFKEEYKKLGNPRFLVYVNRTLIDENSGLKLTSRKQVLESTRANPNPGGTTASRAPAEKSAEHTSSTNLFRVQDRKELSLADRQTNRDIERLFGRPLRMAGAQLSDQGVASQMIGGRLLDPFALQTDSEQAVKDREALSKVADIVVEILISSHDTPVSESNGVDHVAAPDIQATAIRLSDARILGQATAADLIGQGPAAGKAVQTYGIREITEATALSLMEDIMLD